MSTLRVEIPLDAYRALECRIRDSRIAVKKRARALARADGQQEVLPVHLRTALKELSEGGLTPAAGPSPSLSLPLSVEAASLLARRLDALRSLIVEQALVLASVEDDESNRIAICPDDIGRAWDLVWRNSAFLASVLRGDADSAFANVEP